MREKDLTRRAMFMAAAGTAAAAFTSLSVPSQAATTDTAEEKAGINMIRNMIADWNVKGFDPAELVKKYMADDVEVRFLETAPPCIGAAAVSTTWRGYHAHGEANVTKILSAYARGPVVVIHRTDISVTPGKPDRAYEVVGVFIVKNGRIKEWRDYYIRWAG